MKEIDLNKNMLKLFTTKSIDEAFIEKYFKFDKICLWKLMHSE